MDLPLNAGQCFREYTQRLVAALDAIGHEEIDALVEAIYETYLAGKKLFLAGNGGSAVTASHMACDLSKSIFTSVPDPQPPRFKVISLTDNLAILTAWANDKGYESIFSEQLRLLGEPGDLLIVLSASGNSPNIIEVLAKARELGMRTVGLLGFGGGKAAEMVDLAIVVADDDYGPVEDAHMVLDHFLSEHLREVLLRAGAGSSSAGG